MADGLGNQIFRYVCGYAVARERNEELALDIADYTNDTYRSFQMDYFALDKYKKISFPNRTIVGKALRRIARPIKYHVIHEQQENLHVKKMRNVYLDGYYEDLRFYEKYSDDIRRQLKPAYKMNNNVLDAINYCKNNVTCGIHLRLGDRRFDSVEYFNNAVLYMKRTFPNIEFILFSNEIDEAINILKPLNIEYRVVDSFGKLSDIDSFFVLQSCRNQILSVGTYGIWAGILNDNGKKKVCVPKEVYNSISYPVDWIKI